MQSQAKYQTVKLADLEACGERRHFVRRRGESTADHAGRLAQSDEADGTEENEFKVLRYASALSRGGKFPAVVVAEKHGRYEVADGYHRAAAAAWLGRKTIEAMVLSVESDRETDRLMELFYDLEFSGTPTCKAMELVAATHAGCAATQGRHG